MTTVFCGQTIIWIGQEIGSLSLFVPLSLSADMESKEIRGNIGLKIIMVQTDKVVNTPA
ncbi:MAG: hypothetical protein GY774_33170 [Planctomycetes bacterium]|nr:hypothetical protein [Planctomycetota bacterium]